MADAWSSGRTGGVDRSPSPCQVSAMRGYTTYHRTPALGTLTEVHRDVSHLRGPLPRDHSDRGLALVDCAAASWTDAGRPPRPQGAVSRGEIGRDQLVASATRRGATSNQGRDNKDGLPLEETRRHVPGGDAPARYVMLDPDQKRGATRVWRRSRNRNPHSLFLNRQPPSHSQRSWLDSRVHCQRLTVQKCTCGAHVAIPENRGSP